MNTLFRVRDSHYLRLAYAHECLARGVSERDGGCAIPRVLHETPVLPRHGLHRPVVSRPHGESMSLSYGMQIFMRMKSFTRAQCRHHDVQDTMPTQVLTGQALVLGWVCMRAVVALLFGSLRVIEAEVW